MYAIISIHHSTTVTNSMWGIILSVSGMATKCVFRHYLEFEEIHVAKMASCLSLQGMVFF